MMRGLFYKAIRETGVSLVFFGLGLAASMAALTAIIPQIHEGIGQVIESMPFVRTIISSLMGVDVEDQISAQMMQAVVWVHPVVLALTWAAAIVWCTRLPCGEIDRGTIDILLGWPVSRRAITVCEFCVSLVNGVLLITIGTFGHLALVSMVPETMRAGPGELVRILVNMLALYFAVAGLAWLCSCIMERRARAIGLIFAVVLSSFLINFLVQVWTDAEFLSVFSVLRYYQPAIIIRTGNWPVSNLIVLFSIALASWFAGWIVFERRAIRTT